MNKNFNPIYVNCVLLSEDFEDIVFLHKSSGPEFLLNKYNYVGGKQKIGEDSTTSAIREVREEAGIDIPQESIYSVFYKEFNKNGTFYKLQNFAAIVPQEIISQAHTAEKEEVFQRKIKDVVMDFFVHPNRYNSDFKDILINALENTPEEKQNSNLQKILNFIHSREYKFKFLRQDSKSTTALNF